MMTQHELSVIWFDEYHLAIKRAYENPYPGVSDYVMFTHKEYLIADARAKGEHQSCA